MILRTSRIALLIAMGTVPAHAQEPGAEPVPDGLRAVEEARTEACVVEAVAPPAFDVEAELAEEAPELFEVLETSRVAGTIRGGESLPSDYSAIAQLVFRYNREYADFVEACRQDRNADGVGCVEDEDLTELREEIRQVVTTALEEVAAGLVEARGGGGTGHAEWARACDDRLLLRPIVEEVCAAGAGAGSAVCDAAASSDRFAVHGADLQLVDDLESLWNTRPSSAWTPFTPLRLEGGVIRGGFTETTLQFGNVIADVRLSLHVVEIAEEPQRTEQARTFGRAFDMSFETDGLTVLPVIEFSLRQTEPILEETVYAFFIEVDGSPRTVLNAEAAAGSTFAWILPLRPDVAEWLQSGRTLWFTAGGPLASGGMGPRFTVPFSTEGLGDAVLDLAIYLTDGVFTDLQEIAASR